MNQVTTDLGPAQRRVCALLCCHNRRAQTLACLRALQASTGLAHVTLSAVLVDDGSRDGTAEAVAQAFPWVQVVRADGSLFWCRSMHLAVAQAQGQRHDFYLWLNDDTLVQPDAVARLLDTAKTCAAIASSAVIVVGSTVDAHSAALTYGGRRRVSAWQRTRWELLAPSDTAQTIDTMDGNLVLVNAAAATLVGNLDPAFEHAMGDHDYALRARALGVGVWLAAGVHATCPVNSAQGGFNDAALSLRQRWRHMMSRKGLPWRSWARFTRRHAGPLWWVFFAWPYVRVLLGRSARIPAGAPRSTGR